MKYRELRMLCFMGLLFLIALAGSLYFFIDGNTSKGIIGLIISFIAIMTLLTKYRMRIDNDFVVVYVFRGIAILPILIDFKDITEVKLLSKHKMVLHHPKKS
ncbi:MAG: hypothetical protein ACK5LC_05260, partial [Coprobacillaceae bacterium]